MWTVYLLTDPREDIPTTGYIGQTRKTLRQRLTQHINSLPYRKDRAAKWMRDMKRDGITPRIQALQRWRTPVGANIGEVQWIDVLRGSRSMVLLNVQPGGHFVRDEPERVRRIREALADPAERARRSSASKTVAKDTWADSAKRKRRVAGMKRSWTEERKAAARARWADPAFKARVIAAQKVAFAKPELREHLSRTATANNAIPKVKRAIAKSTRRLWADPEHRAMRIAAQKAGIARRNAERRAKEIE